MERPHRAQAHEEASTMSYWQTGKTVGRERHVVARARHSQANNSRQSRADFAASRGPVKPAKSADGGAEISIRAGEVAGAPNQPTMETQMERFKVLAGRSGAEEALARRLPDDCQLESRWRQLGGANESPSADEHRLSIERHSSQSRKQHKLEHSNEQYRSGWRQTSDTNNCSSDSNSGNGNSRGSASRLHTNPSSYTMSDQQRDATATPLSSSSLMGDPLVGLSGTNRATTTERRTTTTTTTKRVVKSSDDFMPSATDIQQVRSESRTGSISSTSPLFGASSLASSQQQQQSQTSTSTQSATSSSLNRNTSKAFTEGFSSPVVQETEEGRVLKLSFDLTQYAPEEILVKTVDNRLTVHAKHEEKSESKSVYREYNREFHLPEGTDVELIRSTLSKDGVLTVDLPLPKTQLVGSSRMVPIDRV